MISVLFDFADPHAPSAWHPINDGVMGGVSRSQLRHDAAGHAVFAGDVRLENNGGFASVRCQPSELGGKGVVVAYVLRVRGDGKTYKFTIRTGDGFDGIQYQQRFTAAAGEWSDVRLPVGDFVATFRGRKVPFAPSLDPAKVRAIGLMISDKQAGSFELLVDRIAIERRK